MAKPPAGAKLTDEQLRERLRDYAVEFAAMVTIGASKEELLNGSGTKHGLNHMTELWNMLPDSRSGEFKVRE